MAWRRLSEREGRQEPDGPFEGVPVHLQGPLTYWLETRFQFDDLKMPYSELPSRLARERTMQLMMSVTNRARVSIGPVVGMGPVAESIATVMSLVKICHADEETFLDILDAVLAVRPGGEGDLRRVFDVGGSVWTVSPDGRSLQRRVGMAVQRTVEQLISRGDMAGEEMKQAWAAAYGRHPDASDAWDHAIKAAEAALIPIVVPAQKKATMGHVLGALRRPEGPWRLLVAGGDRAHSVAPLVGMLQLLWPNPDRHASGQGRAPELDEARAVVQLTATIVQWARDGVLTK